MKQFLTLNFNNHHNLDLHFYPIRINNLPDFKNRNDHPVIKLSNSNYGKKIFERFTLEDDKNIFLEYATKHGQYVESYFGTYLGIRFKKVLLEEKINLKEYYKSYCSFYDINSYKKIEKYIPENIARDFWFMSLYHLSDEIIYSIVKDWYYKHFPLRVCEICGKEYRVTNLGSWVYYGADGNINICFECPMVTDQNKENLLKLIPQLVENCGFIPNSNFSPINHNFSSRVKKENWTATVKTMLQIGFENKNGVIVNNSIKKYFGSWFKALVETGILKDNILITARGIKCIAKSGNECLSLDEQFIDNWLFEHGLKPIKEPVYPKHEKYNSSGRRRADWLVNDYYIEYFGLTGEEKYDKKTFEKLKLVQELNLKIIAVFPEDLNSLDTKFKILID